MDGNQAGRLSRGGAVALLLVNLFLVRASVLSAQDGLHLDLGLGAGTFIDYPAQFSERHCPKEPVLGLWGTGTVWITSFIAVEGGAMVAGGDDGQGCVFPTVPPLPSDTPYQQTVIDDQIREATFFSTTAALVLEPFHGSDLSPRGRIGAGKLWGKDLSTWYWALGMRYRFGRHSILMDVERWSFTIPARLETRIRHSTGGLEVLSSVPTPQTERPYHVRIGWEMELH